jgi:AbrB family looped-hinge helix DNA binding protein
MELSTLSSKGQLTIPIELRKKLELHAGDRLSCFVEEGKLVIMPAKGTLKNLKGIVKKPSVSISVEDMSMAVLDEAQERDIRLK